MVVVVVVSDGRPEVPAPAVCKAGGAWSWQSHKSAATSTVVQACWPTDTVHVLPSITVVCKVQEGMLICHGSVENMSDST